MTPSVRFRARNAGDGRRAAHMTTMGCSGLSSGLRSASESEADLSGGCEVAAHDGEGLVAAPLAGAQAFDGGGVEGVAGQMESAETLDGEDLARREPLLRLDRPASRATGRSAGTHWAGRGSGGRRDLRTRRGSRRTAAKARMVVFGRSYGMSSTMV